MKPVVGKIKTNLEGAWRCILPAGTKEGCGCSCGLTGVGGSQGENEGAKWKSKMQSKQMGHTHATDERRYCTANQIRPE